MRGAEEFSIKKGKLQKADNKISFRKGMAQFVEHDFCGWYSWWVEKVSSDANVTDAKSEYDIEPIFDPTKHLNVAFAKATQQDSLRNICLERSEKVGKSNNKRWKKHDIHAASLDGHLLSMIQQCGRKDNIGVTLAINNTLGPEDPPPTLKIALGKVIYYFVLAVVNAGLREGEDLEICSYLHFYFTWRILPNMFIRFK